MLVTKCVKCIFRYGGGGGGGGGFGGRDYRQFGNRGGGNNYYQAPQHVGNPYQPAYQPTYNHQPTYQQNNYRGAGGRSHSNNSDDWYEKVID